MNSFRQLFIGLLGLVAALSVSAQSGSVGYVPAPNDPYWHVPAENFQQWHLENRASNGVRSGVDSNAREAWAATRGAGVVIAIVDDGVDLEHRDLAGQDLPALNYNFEFNTTDGHHPLASLDFSHGTPVAGLALARGNNGIGVIGLAPEARLASWVIYKTNKAFVDANALAKMFQMHLDKVAVQNHSWLKAEGLFGARLTPMSIQENSAIQKAVTEGRDGKGVIIVRAAGNGRLDGRNANDDAYANDPRAIAVAALASNGAFAEYSNPGASILVSAPGGQGNASLFTTDRTGQELGYNNTIVFENDLSDYVFHSLGFFGTSASAPLVSATAALILSVNPNLHYRDVQQVLLHAAKPSHSQDVDALANGAGYIVSHHTGFGNVDAARAVQIAQSWPSRPPKSIVSHIQTASKPVIDAGLTVAALGDSVPANLSRMKALPTLGVHPENGTPPLPLVNVGLATEPITQDLHGKAALIQRGGQPFLQKLMRAVEAGAEFIIMYNNQGGDALLLMGTTETLPVPAVFIGQNDGDALAQYLQANPGASARINHDRVNYTFTVPESLLCEHVGVRVRTTHQRRGDLRITLLSPSGTTSVLQPYGADESAGPTNWVYYSTHHFYEPSKGPWQVHLSDQLALNTGSVEEVELIIHGVPIQDSDSDGLVDSWEQQWFSNLSPGPRDDPDNDGVQNAREQILGTPPTENTIPFLLSVAPWKPGYLWISWPSQPGPYQVTASLDVTKQGVSIGQVSGEHQRTSTVIPADEAAAAFFQVTKP